jgi:hypothetical protein
MPTKVSLALIDRFALDLSVTDGERAAADERRASSVARLRVCP